MAVSQRESLAPAVLSRDLRSRENRLPHAKAGRLVEVVRVHLASPGGGGHAAAAAAPARLSLDQEHRQSRAPDYELHPFAREVPAGHHSFHRSAALLRGAAPRQRRPSRLGRRVAGKRHRYDHSLLRRVGRSAYPSRELRLTSCLTTDLRTQPSCLSWVLSRLAYNRLGRKDATAHEYTRGPGCRAHRNAGPGAFPDWTVRPGQGQFSARAGALAQRAGAPTADAARDRLPRWAPGGRGGTARDLGRRQFTATGGAA